MRSLFAACCVLSLAIAGCTRLPGTPPPGIEVPRPDSVMDFATLYGQNCAGCHGANGQNGAAFDLANPVYEAWVDDATLRNIITSGEQGTEMPAFGKSAGGILTQQQVDALVNGMRSHWRKSGALTGQAPPYAASLHGSAAQGRQVYQTACARCHQQPSQSITGPTYLALVDDQTLRTVIIAGRPDLGHPDWQHDVPGQPLTDQQITDLVAWLAAQRSQTPGQPYAKPQ